MTEVTATTLHDNSQSTGPSRTNSGRFTELDADKLRGGYYTSNELAQWLCAWAIRDADDFVLEPSCGDGAFLSAAAERLGHLGAKGPARADHLQGIEILADEADKARERLKSQLKLRAADAVETSDFFAWWSRPDRPLFDVAIGNPPFIRYQSFPEPHRSRAMAIMNDQGLSPNRLTNIWVPFVVAAAAALRPGGRMALVLPAELLQVSYAAQLRSFLTDRFGRIDLIACNELFFDKAEQEVLLLLADDARKAPSESNPCQVTLTESDSVASIVNRTPAAVLKGASPKTICHDSEKWLKYFLNAAEIEFMRELRESGVATPMNTYASVNVGVVTGKNQFFVLRQSEIEARGLHKHTMPLISRSAHLMGARVGKRDWKNLAADDQRVHLLHLAPINGSKPGKLLESYIRLGEDDDVHKGYKCSIREPWYAVPSVWVPDAFMFRQIYDFPRVVMNTAEATSTDTIHRMRCKTDPQRVIANTYTYLTAASAEIEGRSYGGGVLELEPTEAERLMMPAELGSALPLKDCDRLVRDGRLDEVLAENDRLVLMGTMGLSRSDCRMLRNVWEKMRDRRLARRRRGKRSIAS
ncbi:MAG: N-6 DNA methylase [Hyphomonas sp.]|nr:N-6 DNA methylase [Hyphomonas sp.]